MSWHLKDEEELARWRGEDKASRAEGTASTKAQCQLRLDHRGEETSFSETGLRRWAGLSSPGEGFGFYSKESLKNIKRVSDVTQTV